MALRLEDKQALVAEVNEVAARAHSVVAAEYGADGREAHRAACQGPCLRVYMRVVKEHAGPPRGRRHSVRVRRCPAQGPADPRLL